MFYVIRDESGNVEKVYGYYSVRDVQNYCENKYPDKSMRWELSVPKEYKGEIVYLPEDDV